MLLISIGLHSDVDNTVGLRLHRVTTDSQPVRNYEPPFLSKYKLKKDY